MLIRRNPRGCRGAITVAMMLLNPVIVAWLWMLRSFESNPVFPFDNDRELFVWGIAV